MCTDFHKIALCESDAQVRERILREDCCDPQFWSAYVPCEAQYKDAVQLTLEQINVIRRLVDGYSAELQFVTSAEGKSANYWRHTFFVAGK